MYTHLYCCFATEILCMLIRFLNGSPAQLRMLSPYRILQLLQDPYMQYSAQDKVPALMKPLNIFRNTGSGSGRPLWMIQVGRQSKDGRIKKAVSR